MIYRLIHYLFPGHVYFFTILSLTCMFSLVKSLLIMRTKPLSYVLINMVIRLKSCTDDSFVSQISPILTTEKHVHKPLFTQLARHIQQCICVYVLNGLFGSHLCTRNICSEYVSHFFTSRVYPRI